MSIKLKWNWGSGIALLYTVFALSIISLVVYSFRQKIDLVTPDYYAKELAYQGQIDKMARAKALPEAMAWEVQKGAIQITLPAAFSPERVKGTVTLFKPSDKLSDKEFELEISESGSQIISTQGFSPGMYKLKIDWQSGDSTFYQEGVIMINA